MYSFSPWCKNLVGQNFKRDLSWAGSITSIHTLFVRLFQFWSCPLFGVQLKRCYNPFEWSNTPLCHLEVRVAPTWHCLKPLGFSDIKHTSTRKSGSGWKQDISTRFLAYKYMYTLKADGAEKKLLPIFLPWICMLENVMCLDRDVTKTL